MSFLDHPAEAELIEIQHSIPKSSDSKTIDLGDVKHLIINPHGSIEVPPVRGLEQFLSRHDSESIRRYLAVERDLAASELSAALAEQVPNTLSIGFRVNRGIIDPNRTVRHALRNIISNAPKDVRAELLARHKRALAAVDEIFGKLNPGVKVSLVHTTEPFDEADQKVHELDLSNPSKLKRFLEVRTNVGKGHGPVIPVCFITGKGDGPTRDDSAVREALQARLKAKGIILSEDNPYHTDVKRHKTSHYMRARPGYVNAVDWPRDMLGTGEIEDGTFSLTESVADSKKVENVAAMFAEAIKESMDK